MKDVNDLRRERADKAAEARRILDTAQEAGRDLEADEQSRFDALMDESDRIDSEINRRERLADHEALADPNADPDDGAPHRSVAAGGDGDRQRTAWNKYLRDGPQTLTADEARVLNVTSDPEGGYLVPPMQFVEQLLQEIDDQVPLRPLANVMQLTEGESMGVPTLDTDLNDAEWTTELATGSQDDSLRFGRRELRPHPLAKRVRISKTLLRKGSLDPEEIVRTRMTYRNATALENGYMTGDGNQKPLGLFVASTDGISTSRDVNTGASGGFSGDGLINAKYALKQPYWRRARWLFHRDSIRDIRKLTDANNQYLWQPGLAGDRPDTLVDIPITVSEFVPNTITDGNYVGMIGDYQFYWILDDLRLQVQRLVELYAESNQTGFISRYEGDGMPVLEEPFVRLKVGA